MPSSLPKYDPSAVAKLASRIDALRVKQEELGREYAEASIKLVEDPEGAEAHQLIEAIENDTAQVEREIARMRTALAVAKDRDSTESRRKLSAALKEQAAVVDKLGDDFDKLVAHVVETLDNLGPVLAQIETTALNRRAAARAITSVSGRSGARGAWDTLADLADGRARSGAAVAVGAALWRSGLGRIGLQLDSWMNWINAPKANGGGLLSRAQTDTHMQSDRARIRSVTQRHLEAAVANLEGKQS